MTGRAFTHVSDVGERVDEREDESDRAEEHVVEAQRLPRAGQYSFSRVRSTRVCT